MRFGEKLRRWPAGSICGRSAGGKGNNPSSRGPGGREIRYVYTVVVTLLFYGGLRFHFALAGVLFLVAGAADVFYFGNEEAGLMAALIGLVCLSCGYMFELWVGNLFRKVPAWRTPLAGPTADDIPQWDEGGFGMMQPTEQQTGTRGS